MKIRPTISFFNSLVSLLVLVCLGLSLLRSVQPAGCEIKEKEGEQTELSLEDTDESHKGHLLFVITSPAANVPLATQTAIGDISQWVAAHPADARKFLRYHQLKLEPSAG